MASHPHVAILAFPFGTHAGPLFALARTLAVAAPPGAAFSFLTTTPSVASLPPFGASDNLRVHAVPDGCAGGAAPSEVTQRIGMFLAAARESFRAGMEAATAAAGGAPVSCVVSDAFLPMAGELAGEMGVPWVPIWTGGPAGLSAHLYTDVLRLAIGVEEQAVPERADESLHFLPGLSAVRVRDLPEGVVFGGLESGFAFLLHRMAEVLPSATAVALNTFEGLDADVDADHRNKFKQSLPVGPFNLLAPQLAVPDDPYGCLSWLDRHDPATVAYISFGTVLSPPLDELVELARGLEASGVPYLWSMRDPLKEHLPTSFLERTSKHGLVVPWAPQVQVLGHTAAGVFVTHCGWNSVLESLTSGVPMVCRPFFGDQKINARFVSQVWRIGVGLHVGEVKREAVAGAMKTVLVEEEGKKMRERACDFKAMAAQAVAPGGSSSENLNSLLKVVCGC